MEQKLVKLSKFLSFVLRHKPEVEELTMDREGWVSVHELLACQGAKRRGLTLALIEMVVAQNEKQRYEFDGTRSRIRARQGHSREVDLGWKTAVPPERLFHGTAAASIPSIRELGLLARTRQYVHLSADADTARSVGGRHGTAVVLSIRALDMHRQGHVFFLTTNGIWLVPTVPPTFIDLP